MLDASKDQYLGWQKRLARDRRFRIFWQIASNYSWLLLVPFGWYLLLISSDKNPAVALILAFVLARFMITPVITFFWPKQRPYQAFGFEPLTSHLLSEKTARPNTFPSRHTVALASSVGVLAVLMPVFAIPFAVVTLWTGVGRVILGYHYPKDILFALILGLIVGVFVALLMG